MNFPVAVSLLTRSEPFHSCTCDNSYSTLADAEFYSNQMANIMTKGLEQRQYKSDSIQSNKIPLLKLARFFPRCIGGEKE